MMSLAQMGSGVIALMMADRLLPLVGLTGILSLDVATFILAILVLIFVHIPQPPRTEEGVRAQGHILQEAILGYRYIFARPGLVPAWDC
jgi:hypothetical protein